MSARRELRAISSGHSFLESPRWHEGQLWVSDFDTHEISAITDDGRVTVVATMPGQPSGLGWLPGGDLLAVSMRDRKVLRLDGAGEWAVHADLSAFPGADFNDMVVDPSGRAYVGALGFDPWQSGARFRTSVLALVYPDGTAEVAADHLYGPNGSAITPDGRTLLVGETFGDRVSAFDIAPDGRLGPRRDWASWGDPAAEGDPLTELARGNVGADGCVLDSDGGLWIADCFHQRVIRVIEGGAITDEITVEDRRAYAVELGGPDGHTLYILVAPVMRPQQRLLARHGGVLATPVGSGRA